METHLDILRSMAMDENLSSERRQAIESVLRDRQTLLPGWSSSFLAKLKPIETVVDIGVLNGTPELYAAFPDAYLVLVEALPPYERACKKILRNRKGEYHICAAGDVDGTAEIMLFKDHPAVSSMLVPTKDVGEFTSFNVPQMRLDTLFKDTKFDKNILLKIDTEGMEYRILRGATEFLSSVKYIIAETAIRRRHEESYRFADLVGLLKASGFDLYDVLRFTRPTANRPGADIADAIFINSKFA